MQPFKFKQFTVAQDRAAMKIGTDGVLLGAWTQIDHEADSILDIGAGTGIIALQMAQRSAAMTIDAIEIDDAAYEQCTENFEAAPWADRLFCYHAGLLEFTQEIDDQYDLIVSNPPFFTADYKSGDEQRDQARFADALPFDHLVICAAKLLADKGSFAVVIPFNAADEFVALAAQVGLNLYRRCDVQGRPETPAKRSLLQFTKLQKSLEQTSLIIETERHQYTEQYIDLVKDFYLKM
ncbi:tRNA (adenine-N(6)-)-methyltransferase [Gilvibacter sp. SZ-19]|uniref:tRNA1(Val) (adenine(37)-N6)-methyltransferase n=1 Tax=Gilvibacter sp. SZ-19 TaxID=754429 RepID=UPI000B3D26E9|nr:methyltransferase [Gilvibacter sp. SZ-19]ARV12189.1 tRNA (adenine-N(6)-)-methyltransferase [Gilvibacter sp. SZ-19]